MCLLWLLWDDAMIGLDGVLLWHSVNIIHSLFSLFIPYIYIYNWARSWSHVPAAHLKTCFKCFISLVLMCAGLFPPRLSKCPAGCPHTASVIRTLNSSNVDLSVSVTPDWHAQRTYVSPLHQSELHVAIIIIGGCRIVIMPKFQNSKWVAVNFYSYLYQVQYHIKM